MSEQKKSVLSAIQPTGDLHFGNYFGAIQNWVKLQDEYRCIYGVVDYHAMTMPYDPKKLRQATWDMVFNLIALGVKEENIFIQSMIPEHTELCWILNNFASYGQLSRMTQFKDKSLKSGEGSDGFVSTGLFDYPVLQAADILIYRADYIPVGKDQEQHIELTRNIAQRFNQETSSEYFVLPESLYTKTPKILSTADPTRKMSKSAGEKHYISVFAEENRVKKQIRSAVTDTGEQIDGEMSPGVSNLFELLVACDKGDLKAQFLQDYTNGNIRYSDLKDAVTSALVEKTSKFRANREEIYTHRKDYKNKIKYSSSQIRKIAQETVSEVKELAGLMNAR